MHMSKHCAWNRQGISRLLRQVTLQVLKETWEGTKRACSAADTSLDIAQRELAALRTHAADEQHRLEGLLAQVTTQTA